MSLHIAIDASRTTVTQVTGTEHYARRLIQNLIAINEKLASPHRLQLYFRDTPAPGLFPASRHVTQHIIPFTRLWTHLRFAAAIWQIRPDVSFVPAHTLPFVFPGKAVVTVHDLGFKHFPEAHPNKQRMYLDLTTRYSQRRASLVLADSQATADDLERFYGTSPEKIRVVYPGVDAPAIGDIQAVRQKCNLPERYFLFIGTLQPRKNIARIVQAFAQWKSDHPNENIGLVLAGGKGWLFDEGWVQGVDDVVLPGYIDDTDKGALMTEAEALLFPTLYEGFGFPVIEAMHCGTPVIASNTSSLPELVGHAGLLVDPRNPTAIAAAMADLLSGTALREELRNKGVRHAATFTWQRAAQATLSALEKAATNH